MHRHLARPSRLQERAVGASSSDIMNDISHERHMNNIIAADREQNIHVRPTTSTRISPRARGPRARGTRARGPTAIAGSSISLVYAACRLMHLKFLAVLRRIRGRTSTQKTAPGARPIEMESARAATSGCSRPQRKGRDHAGCAANEGRDHRKGLES